MTTEQLKEIRARYTLMNTMEEHMCLTNEEYETTKKVRIYGMPTWLLHLIKVDIGDLLEALEAEKVRAEAAEAELLDIKAVLTNAEIEERADQDILQKAEQRAEALERALKRNGNACITCTKARQCNKVEIRTCRAPDYEYWQFDLERFGGKGE